MTDKRYAIVRVDYNCPKDVFHEFNFCLLSKGKRLVDICNHCDFLDEKRIIGDTKEQMILKITQVLIREVLADIKIKVDKRTLEELTKMQRQSAEKIIEFLGVK